MNRPKVVSRDEWPAARKELLAKEKAHTRERDEINRQRRELPWVRIEKEYVFDAPEGKVTLADLFDGRSQLFIKHFMMGPGQVTQCVGCSLEVDHIEGLLVHLENHDVTYAVVARAPIEEIEAVRRRMGWKFRVMPKGRDENGPYHSLADWARPRNMYDQGGTVEANGRYHLGGCACAGHDSATT